MKKRQRCIIDQEGNPVNTELTHIYLPYAYIPHFKKGGRRQKTNVFIDFY